MRTYVQRLGLMAAVLLAFSGLASAQSGKKKGSDLTDVEGQLQKADQLAQKGKVPDAIKVLNALILSDPLMPEPYLRRAYIQMQSKQSAAAVTSCEMVIKLKPTNAEAYYCRALAYTDIGKPDDALADLTEAIRLEPKYTFAYEKRAAIYTALGKKQEAEADLKIIGKAPAPPPAEAKPAVAEVKAPEPPAAPEPPDPLLVALQEGSAFAKANQPEKAIESYTKALALKGDLPATLVDRAKLYHQTGKFPLAIADYTAALQLKPDSGDILLLKCRADVEGGMPEAGVTDCTAAQKLLAKNQQLSAQAFHLIGLSYAAQKQHKKAVEAYTESEGFSSDVPEVHLHAADSYLALDQLAMALKEYTIAIQQRPGYKEAYRGRAQVKQALGAVDGSKEDLAMAAK
jgi:Putative Zn-dependent protease, contains TPR repeats